MVLRIRPEEAAAARRVRPLVQIRDVPVDAERRQIERQHAGRVRAVDEHTDAALAAGRRDLGQGKMSAVSDVMWSMTATRVRGPIAATTASMSWPASKRGYGTVTVRTTARRSRATKAAMRAVAP